MHLYVIMKLFHFFYSQTLEKSKRYHSQTIELSREIQHNYKFPFKVNENFAGALLNIRRRNNGDTKFEIYDKFYLKDQVWFIYFYLKVISRI